MLQTIAIQGDKASFHDIAATKYYGRSMQIIGFNDFKSTFAAVRAGQADVAVCAIENSLYGSINQTYDLLLEHHFAIVGEVYLRVEQCLIGLPGTVLGDIREVYSHPVAIAQCDIYIDKVLSSAERVEYYDTAASVERVKRLGDPTIVAIASREAAQLHGLNIIAESIETNKQNYTRFIVLSKQAAGLSNANKTSLVIGVSDKAGSLYSALGSFASRGINLTKLQSRPIIGKAWQYIFYVDIDVGLHAPAAAQAVEELLMSGYDVRILGSYACGDKTPTTLV
jgi:prephenate dehydratase